MEENNNFEYPKRSQFIQDIVEQVEKNNEARYKVDQDVIFVSNELKRIISSFSQEIDSKCKKENELVSSLYKSNNPNELNKALLKLDECSNGKSGVLHGLTISTQVMRDMFKTQENLCLDDCEKNSNNNELLKSCVKSCISFNYYSYKAIDTLSYEILKSMNY